MSRFLDIVLFMMILVASISFVSSMHLFDKDYVDTKTTDQISTFDITTLNTNATASPGAADILSLGIMWIWEGLVFLLKMVLFVVIVYIPLTQTFHVPSILAAFFQGAIYFVVIMFYIQYKSGRGTKLFDY